MEIPPPMPTVRDAILDLDRRFQQLTVRTVRDRLREMRGFDASTKEIAAALRDFKHGERMAWAGEAAARAWMAASLPDDLDVKPHLESWASEILGFVNSLWGQSYHRFYKVFLVGGGAILLEKHMRAKFNGKSVMADDPVMAIANGLYKIGFGLK